MATPAALKGFLSILRTEQARRAQARGQTIGWDRKTFHEKLDQMAERLRASPGYIEPSPEQKALLLQDLDRYFRSLRN